jgi:hypothetical protein
MYNQILMVTCASFNASYSFMICISLISGEHASELAHVMSEQHAPALAHVTFRKHVPELAHITDGKHVLH